ncbi:leucine-rich repeat domain-containing protein [Prevotella sp. E13-27]|uniref:leucine-rich repeat domain-containing protein n=1 Tax=Prevotella sp. E13-27 TaxID=2938122 RepID=UPI00200AC491|nr:leucine-rich repeat domain-containing protein [Prevotella sp. E13-27]MCK8620793.1 leucine-rich repeat domain-containing protein [Prevotella sp. E13-27]
MRKLLFFLLLAVATTAKAQSLETTQNYTTGYMETGYFDKDNTIKTIDGVLYMLYDGVPIVLVRYPAMNPREEFEVPSTVRRINNNAFQGTKYLKTLKFHNTVTYNRNVKLTIGETAFNDSSIENFVVIENDESAATTVRESHQSLSPKEVARYDLSGRKVDADFKGIQIVTYSDNTAQIKLSNNQ